MTQAINNQLKSTPSISWFSWNTQLFAAKTIIKDILSQDVDCLLMVANAIEGELFVKAMASMEPSRRIPIVSHWGITGGDFQVRVPNEVRSQVQLYFIQSCFSFISSPETELSKAVLAKAKLLFPKLIKNKTDIPAPAGFIHAYDLGKLLIYALSNIKLTGDIKADRRSLRYALDNI